MDRLYWLALNFLRFEGNKKEFRSLFNLAKTGTSIEGKIEEKFLNLAEREEKAVQKFGVKIITFEENDYPENLRNISDPPVLLYVKGDLCQCDEQSVSIVGSRKCTPYGKGVARKFASEFARSGITVVSGLALGIDSEAHKGALDVNGRTIAVLGSGIDKVYPASNLKLFEKIVSSHGAVISEFPLGTKPQKFNFPFRNRIISGISVATVVVEAAEKSGSLITARLAAEQGRDVFAVPGNITSKMSKGTNALIKDGAIPITEPLDLFSYEKKFYSLFVKTNKKSDELNENEEKILSAIENSSETLDGISAKTGISIGEVLRIVTTMEIKGLIKRSGGRYLKV